MKIWNELRRGRRVTVALTGPATTVLVAADPDKRFRLLRYTIQETGGTAVGCQFESSGDPIMGARVINANAGLGETLIGGENGKVGGDLSLVTDAAGVLGGDIWYEEI